MTAFKGTGTTGNGVGAVTPLDFKLALASLAAKTTTPLLSRPGVIYSGNQTLVTGTAGMAYSVAPYQIVTQRSAGAGAVFGGNDGTLSVSTTAAPGSNSRIDIVYHWQREYSLDGVDSNPVIGVIQGTAAASPTAPSLAAFPGAIELARITVPAGVTATNSGTTITQTAPFTALDGNVVQFRNKTAIDLWTNPLQGQMAEDLSTGAVWRWYDLYNVSTNPAGRATAGWKPWETAKPVAYSTTPFNFTLAGGTTVTQQWSARSGRIYVEGKFTLAAGSSISGSLAIATPFDRSAYYAQNMFVGEGAYLTPGTSLSLLKIGVAATADRFVVTAVNAAGTYAEGSTAVNGTVPGAQTVGTMVSWSFDYEAA